LFRLISRPGEQNYGMAMAVSAILIVFVWSVILVLSRYAKESRSLKVIRREER
jgi:ABC-type Fe3+ transport system permease subunit